MSHLFGTPPPHGFPLHSEEKPKYLSSSAWWFGPWYPMMWSLLLLTSFILLEQPSPQHSHQALTAVPLRFLLLLSRLLYPSAILTARFLSSFGPLLKCHLNQENFLAARANAPLLSEVALNSPTSTIRVGWMSDLFLKNRVWKVKK